MIGYDIGGLQWTTIMQNVSSLREQIFLVKSSPLVNQVYKQKEI